jgi:hypothetical protein
MFKNCTSKIKQESERAGYEQAIVDMNKSAGYQENTESKGAKEQECKGAMEKKSKN